MLVEKALHALRLDDGTDDPAKVKACLNGLTAGLIDMDTRGRGRWCAFAKHRAPLSSNPRRALGGRGGLRKRKSRDARGAPALAFDRN
jgi:hypothetical protein